MKTVFSKIVLIAGWLFFTSGNSAAWAMPEINVSGIKGSANTVISERVMTEAYKRMGYHFKVTEIAAKAALPAANSGRFDGELFRIDGMAKKFPNLIQVPVPINQLEGIVFTREVHFEVKGWESLRPYRIGIQSGVKFAENGTKGMQVATPAHNVSLLRMLELGRVDIAVMARLNGVISLQALGPSMVKQLPGVIEAYPLYHYLHRKNAHLLKPLTKILTEMQDEGVIEKARQDYIQEITQGK